MAHDSIIYQGDFYKLSEARKLFIGSKSDSWKLKYVIILVKDNVPVLEIHKKKPKSSKKSDKTLTDSYDLPSFKLEKLKNARGRSFVCEITASNFHLFLSADEEKQIDILVFLLQTQLRLKDEIRDDIIQVIPEDSECQKRIGAKGSNCLLHISPWGLTLILQRSRCLLAQWPLKSIRYYEASGTGHFTIEAGRVAPMGDGVFGFQTLVGDDDIAYDKVDNYIVNTLDRVKPNQRGTKEEIEDYIREHDHLHALTTVTVTSISQREIQRALKFCWDMGRSSETFTEAVLEPRGASSSTESSARNSASSTHTSSLNVTLERLNMSDAASSKSDHSLSDSRHSTGSRPPLPTSKSHNGGVPRRSQRRDHSIPRKVDMVETDTYGSSPRLAHHSRQTERENRSPQLPPRPTTSMQPRRHSNPSNILHQVSNPDSSVHLHPYVNQHQHTEFYNLNSPNLKVRKCKSPVVTRHRNKVGRAELLLNIDQSGVRTPSMSSPSSADTHGLGRWDSSSSQVADEDKEEQDYLDAITKASQQKYGHNSIDRTWAKMKRDLSRESQNSPLTPGYINTFPPTGYINIQKLASMEENAATHKRQNSLDSPSPSMSRQNSKTSQGDPTLSPPIIRHGRQRSAPVESVSSVGSVAASNQSYLTADDSKKDSEIQSNDSEINMRTNGKNRKSSEDLTQGSPSRQISQLSGFSTFDQLESPVADWLISASCEDLSDHMRLVIYNDDDEPVQADAESKDEENENTYEEIQSDKEDKSGNNSSSVSTSNDKPPLPFTGLKKFQNKVDIGNHRDRSKSFGYMNITQSSPNSGAKPQSTAPSAHLIRKMVAARAKQDNTLRKSLSNPNFLNLGSKEHLFNMKTVTGNMGSNGSSLQASAKQKSRSFSSLFPSLKKALSRESLGHSRSTTPERRLSFSLRRRSSEHEYRRRNSLHAVGEMTIKGIRMTERSRSFRRVRGAKSVETLSTHEDQDNSRLSTATNISSPPAMSDGTSSANSSPSKSPNTKSKTRPSSSSKPGNGSVAVTRSSTDSKLLAPVPSLVPPESPIFMSNIEINLLNSRDSMSPAPSPSHLPPPPVPARRPRVNGTNQNETASNSLSPSPANGSNHHSQNPSDRSSNYMNTVSINKADSHSRDKRDSNTSLSSNRSKRRVSDKSDKMAMEFAGGSRLQNGPSESSKTPSSSETHNQLSPSKKKVPAKAVSSKTVAKS